MTSTLLALAASLAAHAAPALPPVAATPYDRTLQAHPYPFPVQSHRFSAQGQDLEMAYMDVAPEGPPKGTVVLLHGKNFAGDYWVETVRVLQAQGYRVVVPDQVGFGRSSKPLDLQYSFHALAGWTAGLLRALGVEEATVVGHSMGGMVATRFALSHADLARGLVLVNPIGLEDWQQLTPYRDIDAWTERNRKATPEGVRAYMSKAYFDGAWRSEWDHLLAVQAGWAVGPDKEHMARLSAIHYDMIYTQPVVHELAQLQEPTLLVIGERDRTALNRDLVTPEQAAQLGRYEVLGERAAAAIPEATLVELPGIGHVPQVEAPEQWRAALLDFVAGQWGG